MEWTEGNVAVAHHREAWPNKAPAVEQRVLVHCRFDQINGNWIGYPEAARPAYAEAYGHAKFGFDTEAALDIIERCASASVIDEIVDIILRCKTLPRLLFPHPAFNDPDVVGFQDPITPLPTNALPFAYARYLSNVTGCVIEENIIQSERVGRTHLGMWLRFLCQPKFTGRVTPEQPYILLDDIFTTGGTFAALRTFILHGGGSVACVTTVGHKDGKRQEFGIAPHTADVLRSMYGDGLAPYWKGAIGHDVHSLTEAEGQFLARWATDAHRLGIARGDPLLQQLRTRINKAAATGG